MEECEIADKHSRNIEDASNAVSDEPVPAMLSALVEELSLSDLKTGAVFEVEEDNNTTEENDNYFNDKELLNNLNIEDTVLDDSDDEKEPFERLKEKMTVITEGIYKRVKEKGHGILAPEKSYVTIHYNNYLEYGDEPFDSTRLRNKPAKFILNTGGVIYGLDIGIATMQTGEISQFLIVPEYAFGPMGVPPRIPPEATILCEVELISFVDSTDITHYNELTAEERKEATFEKKVSTCRSYHEIGCNFYQEKNYRKAIINYRWAVNILENASLVNEEEEMQQS